jgi:hypothetical protein
LIAYHLFYFLTVIGQPQTFQFSLVGEDECSAPCMDKYSIEMVRVCIWPLPHQPASHPEVEQDGRAVRRGQQPLSVPFRLAETATS